MSGLGRIQAGLYIDRLKQNTVIQRIIGFIRHILLNSRHIATKEMLAEAIE